MEYLFAENLVITILMALLVLSCAFIFGNAIRGIYREFTEKKKEKAGTISKQVFELTYRDEKEEKDIKHWKESGLSDYFKKLNDMRCECVVGESPWVGIAENIRVFFARLKK